MTTEAFTYLKEITTGEREVATWMRTRDGTHRIRLLQHNSDGENEVCELTVTDIDLAAVDKRLPSVVRAIAKSYHGYVVTEPIVLTCTSHWLRKNYRLPALLTSQSATTSTEVDKWYVHEFIDGERQAGGSASVAVHLYDVLKTVEGVEFVSSRLKTRLFHLETWLHECIPGGLQVFDVLEGLDVPQTEWGAYLQSEYEKQAVQQSLTKSPVLPNDL